MEKISQGVKSPNTFSASCPQLSLDLSVRLGEEMCVHIKANNNRQELELVKHSFDTKTPLWSSTYHLGFLRVLYTLTFHMLQST